MGINITPEHDYIYVEHEHSYRTHVSLLKEKSESEAISVLAYIIHNVKRQMWTRILGHGGALVETITFNRRVVGSTPAQAAT